MKKTVSRLGSAALCVTLSLALGCGCAVMPPASSEKPASSAASVPTDAEGKPRRVQGCFITDDEVQEVVSFVKASSEAEYSDTVMAEIDKKAAESGKSGSGSSGSAAAETDGSDGDEMLPAAVDVILETGQASVSMLQRRLKLGYARAARIMDEMEERGIVGPFEGSKPRQLLITREQWQAIKDGAPTSSEPVEEEIP